MQKKGKIKYTDLEKAYGYIVAEDTDDPTETILFELEDVEVAVEELVPGKKVVFEVEDSVRATQAKQVRTA